MSDEICTFFSSFFRTPRYKLFKPPAFILPDLQAESEDENRDDQEIENTVDKDQGQWLSDKKYPNILCVSDLCLCAKCRLTHSPSTYYGWSITVYSKQK